MKGAPATMKSRSPMLPLMPCSKQKSESGNKQKVIVKTKSKVEKKLNEKMKVETPATKGQVVNAAPHALLDTLKLKVEYGT